MAEGMFMMLMSDLAASKKRTEDLTKGRERNLKALALDV